MSAPGLPDPLLNELYSRYALYYMEHEHMTQDEALAAVELRFGVVLTPAQRVFINNSVGTAITGPELFDLIGDAETVQGIFPDLPEGTLVELRFQITIIDSEGAEIGQNTKVVVVPVGATTLESIRAKILSDARSGLINTSPKKGRPADFTVRFMPSLPFETTRPPSAI